MAQITNDEVVSSLLDCKKDSEYADCILKVSPNRSPDKKRIQDRVQIIHDLTLSPRALFEEKFQQIDGQHGGSEANPKRYGLADFKYDLKAGFLYADAGQVAPPKKTTKKIETAVVVAPVVKDGCSKVKEYVKKCSHCHLEVANTYYKTFYQVNCYHLQKVVSVNALEIVICKAK